MAKAHRHTTDHYVVQNVIADNEDFKYAKTLPTLGKVPMFAFLMRVCTCEARTPVSYGRRSRMTQLAKQYNTGEGEGGGQS